MATIEILRDEKTDTITLRLEGTLNEAAAIDLHRELDRLNTHQVVIDFSHLRQFLDSAVPEVVEAIRSKDCQLQGLMRHHARMFRYFGHTTPQAVERDFGAPEEPALM
jgi:2'-5' RNA ligase